MSQFSTFGGSGNVEVDQSGTRVSFRPKLNFIGAAVADNPGTNSADITIGFAADIDGGHASSIYLAPSQILNGGHA